MPALVHPSFTAQKCSESFLCPCPVISGLCLSLKNPSQILSRETQRKKSFERGKTTTIEKRKVVQRTNAIECKVRSTYSLSISELTLVFSWGGRKGAEIATTVRECSSSVDDSSSSFVGGYNSSTVLAYSLLPSYYSPFLSSVHLFIQPRN